MLANRLRKGGKTPKFMISGWSGKVSESKDGIIWAENATIGYTVRSSIYVKELGLWIIGTQEGKIFTSSDLTNWTERISPLAGNIILDFAYGNSVIVCVSSGAIASSSDGINWTLRSSGLVTHENICFAEEKFVVGGNNGTSTRTTYSTNGISWTVGIAPNWSNTLFVAYSPYMGRFIAINSNGGQYAYSLDGIDFSDFGKQFPNTGVKRGMKTLVNGLMVVSGLASGQIYTSIDGENWTLRQIGAGTSTIWDVDYNPNNGLYVAAGGNSNNAILSTSPDLVNWTPRTPTGQTGTNSTIAIVTFGGD